MTVKAYIPGQDRLAGVHPDIERVLRRAVVMGAPPFRVIEGVRSIEKQRENVRRGASKTMNSRHLTGHAVDIVPLDAEGQVSWDWPLYYPLAEVIKQAAQIEGVPLEWGGDWKKFKDGPHWQLPWDQYPVDHHDPKIAAAPKITMRSEADLTRSRTVAGGAAAGIGGAVVAVQEARNALSEAKPNLEAGDILGLALGLIILLGALITIYARWDDAGRPWPWRRA